MKRSWRPNKDCNILTSSAPPDIAVCRSHSPDAQLKALGLRFLLAFFTIYFLQLVYLQLTGFLSSPSYIIVQSPTQSLEWHVWSSSNGNNCHAVQRSLSSGASVYECIMGFYLVPFRQPNPPTRFLSITGHWNVSLPSGPSLWNGMFGQVEGQYTTMRQLRRWKRLWRRS